MARPGSLFKPSRQHLVLLVLAAAAVYILLPQFGDFRGSWHLLRHPRPFYTVLAVLLTFGTYVAAATTYCLLAFKRLRFGQTVLVQLSSMFINRLLPAGIGAVGVNYLYLHRERHTPAQAASVVAVNNLWGFVGNGLLIFITLVFFPGTSMIDSAHLTVHKALFVEIAAVAVVVGGLALFLFGRGKVVKLLRDVRKQLASYQDRPFQLAAALGSSTALTLCNVLCLACCALALGIHLSFAAMLLILTFGVSAGAAVPTPGGLGAFEAALAAGFAAYGIDTSAAIAAALLYRLISYWLPIAAGVLAFIICQRRQLFSPA